MSQRHQDAGESLAAVANGSVSATSIDQPLGYNPPWLFTLIYALAGAVWIVGSDYILGSLIEPEYWGHVRAQAIKGIFFILVTATSLYVIMSYYARRIARKNAALLAFEKAFRDHAESASDWLWERDSDLRLTRLSGRFEEITGENPNALVGKPLEEMVARADPQTRRRLLDDVAAHRPFRDVVYPYADAAGNLRHFRFSGKPIHDSEGRFLGYRGIGSDVTEEVRLRGAHDRMASIIDATPDLVATATVEGEILLVNRALRNLLGISDGEPGTRLTLDDLHPPEVAKFLRDQAIPEVLTKGSWVGRTEVERSDGTTVTVSQVILAHKGSNGDVEFISTIARDLTEEIRAEQRLRLSQKMDGLGQLTGGVAHDFNNILAVVLGNAEYLADALDDNPSARELAEAIMRAAERGADLTHRLLAFSRQQTLEPNRTDLRDLVPNMDRLLRRTIGEHIEVDTRIPAELWPVFADASELEAAILNLAINARDAMPDGGTLTIELGNEHVDEGEALAEAGLKPGDYVVLSVADTGVGISRDVKERIFEPFFTTKEEGKGTGLGLSMVYGFVKQSGGHISVYSEAGHGTVFRLYLPRDPSPDVDAPKVAMEAELPRGAGETILVAEDDPLVRDYVTRQLISLGYHVHAVENGPDALVHLDHDPRVDLLLLDFVMPGGLLGPDVAREARHRRPGIQVIFTSGYPRRVGDGKQAFDADTPLLQKPYRRHKLAQVVRNALDAPGSDA